MNDKIKLVLDNLKKIKPARVVIDSVSSLTFDDGMSAKQTTRLLLDGLEKIGATAIITGEAIEGDYPDKYTPFLVDGVIVMKKQAVGS